MQIKMTIIMLVTALIVGVTQPAAAQEERRVLAFYMGFWAGQQSWDWQADVLSDYPAIGAYDSRDGGVAGTQIDQAKSAGIDGFVVSWNGVGDQATSTPVLNNLLDRAGERGFQVGAALDAFTPDFLNNPDALVQSLNWLVNDRANHPAYLRYQGKPMIFFAFQSNLGLSAGDWQNIRNTVDPDRNTLWIAEGVNGCCLYGGAMDGMYAFNLAWANGSRGTYTAQRNSALNAGASLYIPSVHPGWDESAIAARDGRPNPTSPRGRAGGQFLANSFQNAAASGANVILIGTWNEYMENSHIEPSQQHGNQSLDTLRPLVEQFKSGAGVSAPADNAAEPVPDFPAVQARTRLNVRAGGSTDFDVIGVISPGRWYGIIREEGGWFVIDYNGREGYVSGDYVNRN